METEKNHSIPKKDAFKVRDRAESIGSLLNFSLSLGIIYFFCSNMIECFQYLDTGDMERAFARFVLACSFLFVSVMITIGMFLLNKHSKKQSKIL